MIRCKNFVDTFETRRQSIVSAYIEQDEEQSWKYDLDK